MSVVYTIHLWQRWGWFTIALLTLILILLPLTTISWEYFLNRNESQYILYWVLILIVRLILILPQIGMPFFSNTLKSQADSDWLVVDLRLSYQMIPSPC